MGSSSRAPPTAWQMRAPSGPPATKARVKSPMAATGNAQLAATLGIIRSLTRRLTYLPSGRPTPRPAPGLDASPALGLSTNKDKPNTTEWQYGRCQHINLVDSMTCNSCETLRPPNSNNSRMDRSHTPSMGIAANNLALPALSPPPSLAPLTLALPSLASLASTLPLEAGTLEAGALEAGETLALPASASLVSALLASAALTSTLLALESYRLCKATRDAPGNSDATTDTA